MKRNRSAKINQQVLKFLTGTSSIRNWKLTTDVTRIRDKRSSGAIFLLMTKSMCIAVQLSKFFSTEVNFIMSAF